jgi:hypothetical protein
MSADLLESARERAQVEDRSLSAVVRVAVRQYVAGEGQLVDAGPERPAA